MHRKTQIAATITAVLTLAPAGALAAAPSFSSPLRIIGSTPNVPTAVNAAGQALTLRPGSGTDPALQLARAGHNVLTFALHAPVAGYDNPSVAISRAGVLAATWDTSSIGGSSPTVVNMSSGSFSGHTPRIAFQLSAAGAAVSGERAFVTPTGTAVVLWDETDAGGPPTVRAAIVAAGATPSPVTLDANATFIGAGIGVGGALVVVERSQGGLVQRTIAADGTVGPALAFTAPAAVVAAAATSGELGVLVDGAGDQLYSWTPTGAGQQLHAVWRSAAGSFGAVQSLGLTVALAADGPDIALNAAGRAVAVVEPKSTGPLTVRFAARLGRFASASRVGSTGRYADMPALSIDGAGRTVLAWVDSPRSSRGTTVARELVAVAHGSKFSAPQVLPVDAGLGHRYLGDSPLPAAAADGSVTLVTYGAASRSRTIGLLAFLRG
jgi:hypothetical protein